MRDEFATVPKFVINLFFIIGTISAISFRIIIFFQESNPQVMRLIWYIGVIGYLFFFYYRYLISRKRRAIIYKYHLQEKLETAEGLTDEERKALRYLVHSIVKSRENYNYYIIFILSFLTIAIDVIMSFL